MHEGGRNAIVAALAANLGIAVAKTAGWLGTGSTAMLAEAIHSVADTGNQLLLFLGARSARRVADPHHPFGYGRARYFWAFVVALVLFSLGGVFSVFEGIEKIRHPEDLGDTRWALAILATAVVLESFSLRTAVREARPHLRGGSWWRFIRSSRVPELPVVLLEDAGALIGLAFAGLGISLATWSGDPRWDAAGSLAVGVLLVAIATVLAIETQSLLLGESARPEIVAEIAATLATAPRVQRLIHLRTEHLGPDEVLVAAKIAFAPTLTMAELAGAIDECERRVRLAEPNARWIYVEPDLWRTERSGGTPVAT